MPIMKSRPVRILISALLLFTVVLVFAAVSITGSGDAYTKAVYSWGRSLKDYRADFRRKPIDVLRFSGIKPGMKVVDLLGGEGYYTELISKLVGDEGQVYLQNNSLFLRFSAEGLEKRLANNRLPNVTRLDSEFADFRLPEGVDFIFMGLSYHDIYVPREDPVIMTNRDEFFPQLVAALKPGGMVLVIDHAAEPGSGTKESPVNHRIAEDYAIQDFRQAGFEFKGSIDVLRNSDDDHTLSIWDDRIEDKTDKFIYLFQKI